MAKQLYIGAADTHIFTKKGRLTVNKGVSYVFDPSEIKGNEWAFRTAEQQTDFLLGRQPVEQATAAPGEVRTTPPRKSSTKKPAAAK